MKKLFTVLFLLLYVSVVQAQQEKAEVNRISDSIQLKEVVISEVMPLNNKQIEKFYKANSVATIDNLVGRLDGIALIRRGAYAMEPTLNGFSGGQLNITIDGMKMFGACTDKMDPVTSYIEPCNLKKITVKQGSNGCQSGSNTGGAMDLSLLEPSCTGGNPFYLTSTLGYESVSNGKTALLSAGYVKDKWQLGINGAYRKSDDYTDGYGQQVPYTQFEKTNIHTVLKYLPDSISSLKADFLYDLALNVGYAALPMDVAKARAYIVALEYRRQNRFNLDAKIYFNSILHIMDDSKRDSTFYVKNHSTGELEKVYMRMDMPGESSTLGAFATGDIILNRKSKVSIKVDNYTNHSMAEMTMYMQYPGSQPEPPMYLQTWPDMIRSVTGIFAQYSDKISKHVVLNISGRVDYDIDLLQTDLVREQFSVFNYNLSGKYTRFTKSLNISLQDKISSVIEVDAEMGYSERLPTISELYGFYLYNAYDGYDYIGNPDLETERSFFGRIGIQFTKSWLKFNLSQSVNFVRSYIMGINNSLIPPMNFYTNGTRVYSNVPGAFLYNLNFQAQSVPVDGLSVYLLAKYTWGALESGAPLPLIPPFNNIITVNYQHGRWSIQAENETAAAQNRINVAYGEIPSPSYTVFSVKGSYHLMFLKPVMLDISLGVTNIFNAKYYEHLDWGQIYRPGRSFDINLRISI